MANFVIKHDGTRVNFDIDKVKTGVRASAIDAGLSDDQANDLANKISSSISMNFESQEEVSSSDIRDKILSELDESQPAVAAAWRTYEENKG